MASACRPECCRTPPPRAGAPSLALLPPDSAPSLAPSAPVSVCLWDTRPFLLPKARTLEHKSASSRRLRCLCVRGEHGRDSPAVSVPAHFSSCRPTHCVLCISFAFSSPPRPVLFPQSPFPVTVRVLSWFLRSVWCGDLRGAVQVK